VERPASGSGSGLDETRMLFGSNGTYVPSLARKKPGSQSEVALTVVFFASATWIPRAVATGSAASMAMRPGTMRSQSTRLSRTPCSRWLAFPLVARASTVRLTDRSTSTSTSKGTLNGSPP
jgi:hypothetical protein